MSVMFKAAGDRKEKKTIILSYKVRKYQSWKK